MSRVMLGGLAATALVAAFLLGTRFARVERVEVERERAGERAAPAAVTVTAAPSGGALTAEQVRAIVREELAHAGEPAEPAPEVVETRHASADRAYELVARALDRGTWSEQDRDELRTALQDLERAQIDDVLVELFPALNDGRVKLTYDGTPI